MLTWRAGAVVTLGELGIHYTSASIETRFFDFAEVDGFRAGLACVSSIAFALPAAGMVDASPKCTTGTIKAFVDIFFAVFSFPTVMTGAHGKAIFGRIAEAVSTREYKSITMIVALVFPIASST